MSPTEKPAEKSKAKPKKKKAATKKPPQKPQKKVQNLTCKLSNIELPEKWNRKALDKKSLAKLMASIKTEGQKVPLLVRPHPEKKDKYILVDGRRRYSALLELGAKEAFISISTEDTEEKAYLTSLIANLNKEDNTAYEIAEAFGYLVSKGVTHDEIAQACGYSSGYVSQHLSVLKAHKNLQNALMDQKIPFSVFRHFSKINPEEDAKFYERMMAAVIEKGMTAQTLGDKIDIYVAKKQEAAKKSGKETKTRKPKKRAGPKIHVTDYDSPEVAKAIKPLNKTKLLVCLKYGAEKLKSSVGMSSRKYNQGFVDGLECAGGLIEIE